MMAQSISFMVEIDRGTMPVVRSNFEQTSFERKMRAYLTAHAAKQHEQRFGWKTFRVLTVTTDEYRMQSMIDALRRIHVPHSPGRFAVSLYHAPAFCTLTARWRIRGRWNRPRRSINLIRSA